MRIPILRLIKSWIDSDGEEGFGVKEPIFKFALMRMWFPTKKAPKPRGTIIGHRETLDTQVLPEISVAQ